MAESEYFGRINMAESEWYGRVNMSESEYFGRIGIGWPKSSWGKHPSMAESYALVVAIKNLAYHRHHLVLGASDVSAHAWLG